MSVQIENKIDSELYCKLFIAGLSSLTDPRSIVGYFSQFGSVRLEKSRFQAEEINRSKGHCVLKCSTPDIAITIAEIRNFNFFGRPITALPFKTGKQLIVDNTKLNCARVIIKKIPKGYSLDKLRFRLETLFGPLNTLFKFIPDQSKLMKDKSMARLYQKYDSYSAIFQFKVHAKNLILQGTLELEEGITAVVEKFKLRSKKKVHEASSSNNQKKLAIQVDNTDIKSQHLLAKMSISSLYLYNKGKPDDKQMMSLHHIKPTKRYYYSSDISKTVFNNISSYTESSTNLRYNILSRQQ